MAEKPDTTNLSAQPGAARETYAAGFLRLMALRQSIEQTLAAMAALLDEDHAGLTGLKNNPVTIPVRYDRRVPR